MLHLEAIEQFAFDEAVDKAVETVFDPFADKQREHHRHGRGQRDGGRVERFAHLGHDDGEPVGHLIK